MALVAEALQFRESLAIAVVLYELWLCLIPLDPNEILHLNDLPISRILVFAGAHQLVNEKLGPLMDIRLRLLSYVLDLSSQALSQLPLLFIDLINREDVRNMNRAAGKSPGHLWVGARSAKLEDDVLDEELLPWYDVLLEDPDALCDLELHTRVALGKL